MENRAQTGNSNAGPNPTTGNQGYSQPQGGNQGGFGGQSGAMQQGGGMQGGGMQGGARGPQGNVVSFTFLILISSIRVFALFCYNIGASNLRMACQCCALLQR
ncbi:hypothetical protein ABBQ32_000612 [Trebouxia sp. C0010 RCD-2024]